MANLKLIDIKKSYGKTEVIHGLDLEVLDGETLIDERTSHTGLRFILYSRQTARYVCR